MGASFVSRDAMLFSCHAGCLQGPQKIVPPTPRNQFKQPCSVAKSFGHAIKAIVLATGTLSHMLSSKVELQLKV